MASPTQWTWVLVNSGSWWWIGRPGVLQVIGPQRVDTTERMNWTEMNWTELSDARGPLWDLWMLSPEVRKEVSTSFKPSLFWNSLYASKLIFNWNTLPCNVRTHPGLKVIGGLGSLNWKKSELLLYQLCWLVFLPIFPVLRAYSPDSAPDNFLSDQAITLSYTYPASPPQGQERGLFPASRSFHVMKDIIYPIPLFLLLVLQASSSWKPQLTHFLIIPKRSDSWFGLNKTQIVMAHKKK